MDTRARVLSRADRHDVDAVLDAARGDPRTGLDPAEAERRLAELGRNELPDAPQVTLGDQVATQLREPMAILLLVTAAVSGVVLGEAIDAAAIAVIVVINAAIAIVEERRAEMALTSLRALTVPVARVRRGGAVREIPSAAPVPGDIVLLESGDRVPADLRLLVTAGLEIDESMLTGESLAARKNATVVTTGEAGLGERAAGAHTGTFVTRGTATSVVVGTGARTTLAASRWGSDGWPSVAR